MSEPTIVFVPGLGGSGPEHWQSLWNKEMPNSILAEQVKWDEPELGLWLEGLDNAIDNCEKPIVLVAHSIGCALVAHWIKTNGEKASDSIAGAMLVTSADVDSEDWTPDLVRCFAPIPLGKMPFPSLLITSEDDPYGSKERVTFFGESWGSEIISVGEKGHVSDNVGAWPEGKELLSGLINKI